jgi:hypothetical protein
MNITVLHPRLSGRYVQAEVLPVVTGGQLIADLSNPQDGQSAFLEECPPGQGYMLVNARSMRPIQENETLTAAGVQEGDTLRTVLDVNGYTR